jgi:hypothetical protein
MISASAAEAGRMIIESGDSPAGFESLKFNVPASSLTVRSADRTMSSA